jgi:hypothetical protein
MGARLGLSFLGKDIDYGVFEISVLRIIFGRKSGDNRSLGKLYTLQQIFG